jgi:hypothetical protein
VKKTNVFSLIVLLSMKLKEEIFTMKVGAKFRYNFRMKQGQFVIMNLLYKMLK